MMKSLKLSNNYNLIMRMYHEIVIHFNIFLENRFKFNIFGERKQNK